ncbi:MAG TPA: GNAT family N-acetyltransferase [Solirubrobacterales bacterium]|nr:GNAT family N-acetyltransferase [Solirubrobacterales bacterium]
MTEAAASDRRSSFVSDTGYKGRTPDFAVREGGAADVEAVATAVGSLLEELGGRMPSRPEMEAEVQALLDDPRGGSVLIAAADGEIVGVLTASWQRAIHVPGVYATIQDLWVDEAWRSRGVGAELVEAIASQARARGVSRLEVGLPRETFAAIASTESFYKRNGFEHLGPRMRRLL